MCSGSLNHCVPQSVVRIQNTHICCKVNQQIPNYRQVSSKVLRTDAKSLTFSIALPKWHYQKPKLKQQDKHSYLLFIPCSWTLLIFRLTDLFTNCRLMKLRVIWIIAAHFKNKGWFHVECYFKVSNMSIFWLHNKLLTINKHCKSSFQTAQDPVNILISNRNIRGRVEKLHVQALPEPWQIAYYANMKTWGLHVIMHSLQANDRKHYIRK